LELVINHRNPLLLIAVLLLLAFPGSLESQNSTFSPYSRYGLGEPTPQLPAHNMGMAGTHLAWKPDSTMPIFLNTGNPASYSLIRLTALEVGGRYTYSRFVEGGNAYGKWSTNFSYAAIGVPIKRSGGLCFGLLPYTFAGYDSELKQPSAVGDLTSRFGGSGGISKVFIGYGVMPFRDRWIKFRRRQASRNLSGRPDTVPPLSNTAFRLRNFGSRFIGDLSAGFNVNYLFGNLYSTTRIIFPNNVLYNNTYFENTLDVADFTGNFGLQGAVSIDSVKRSGRRTALKEPVKFTFGFFMNAQNPVRIVYNDISYNYILNAAGSEIVRDTVLYNVNQVQKVTLPLEQGFGIGFKKAERLNIVADLAFTGWSKLRYNGNPGNLADNMRLSLGMNLVPEKYAAGRSAYYKRINYRFGISHETGYIRINGNQISNSFVTVGAGIPVGIGRLSSMVNVSLQAGTIGSQAADALRENYFRVHFGFTFCDRWFQKFRHD
jgi:hypothetical protein